MIVILDTNIIVADFKMESPMFRNLFENVQSNKLELRIPAVVKDEVLNKYKQFLEDRRKKINDEISRFNRMAFRDVTSPFDDYDIDEMCEQYEQHLTKILSQHGIEVIEYPKTSHEKMALKEMKGIKPFKSEKGGYRDALIWESIKSLVPDEHSDRGLPNEIVFVTANKKDFMLDKTLHPDLLNELEEEELKTNVIVLYEKLGEFLDEINTLYLITEKAFEDRLKNEDFEEFNLQYTIAKYLLKNFVGQSYEGLSPYAEYCNDSPYVSSINDNFELADISVKKLGSGSYIIDANLDLEMELDYFIDKSDYWGADDLSASAIDLDWNNHVVAVESEATVPIQVSIFVSPDLEVKSIEVSKIGDEYKY